jgi:hypothetical protein
MAVEFSLRLSIATVIASLRLTFIFDFNASTNVGIMDMAAVKLEDCRYDDNNW